MVEKCGGGGIGLGVDHVALRKIGMMRTDLHRPHYMLNATTLKFERPVRLYLSWSLDQDEALNPSSTARTNPTRSTLSAWTVAITRKALSMTPASVLSAEIWLSTKGGLELARRTISTVAEGSCCRWGMGIESRMAD